MAIFTELKEDENYLQEVAPNLWLMDDHRWSFYVWEAARVQNCHPYSLVHLDYHFDGNNDFQESQTLGRLLAADTDEIFRMVRQKDHVQYDSFIVPAVIRGLIKEIHFYCKQEDTDKGIDVHLLEDYGCDQFFYENIKDLVGNVNTQPILFDLCLDLFNFDDDMMYEGTLWDDSEVLAFMEACRPLLSCSSITTVSLSFGYSGTEEQTKHLAEAVVPICLECMK